MAKIAAAFGSSHSIMLVSERDDWMYRYDSRDPTLPYYDLKTGEPTSYAAVLERAPAHGADLVTPPKMAARYDATEAAMDRMRDEIQSANLDALVIIGDDQEELFQLTNMPAIAIYYGDTIRNAGKGPMPEEWQARARWRRLEDSGDVQHPCHPKLALHLIEGLNGFGFDIAAMKGLEPGQMAGHAISFIHYRYFRGRRTVPVVPILVNAYYPPNAPTPKRCVQLGAAVADLVKSFPDDMRVGILASGGLSHFIVDEALDHAVLDAIKSNDIGFLAGLDPRRLKAGSSEIRCWIAVAAAVAKTDLKVSWQEYIPVYRTKAMTGIGLGFLRWS
ncbi:MAG TPA: protocatechuate 3,4-dioxygenase [Alphaproteobacteria bacterium]